jgi:integrase
MGFRVSFREHRQADGTKTLYARFRTPVRQEDGKIRWKPCERSTGTSKKLDARRFAEAEYQKAYDEAHKPREHETGQDSFAAAALSYMRNKGPQSSPVDGLIPADRLKARANKKYLIPIIERVGHKTLAEITQRVVDKLQEHIYPGCSAATIDRQLYTPIIAVMRHAKHRYQLKRPAGADSLPQLDVPTNDWYPAVLRAANPYLRAFIITERLTGRRPDELLNRQRNDFNDEMGTLAVWDGKGKQHIVLTLPEPALIAIRALPDLRMAKKGATKPGERLTHAKRHFLFGTNHKSTMREWLVDACNEAGVRYHMAKEAGRHAFVTKNLEEGKSLKWVMEAGRWKTLKIVAEKYGHLERQEVDRQAREAGEEWFKKILSPRPQIEGRATTQLPLGFGEDDGDKRKRLG